MVFMFLTGAAVFALGFFTGKSCRFMVDKSDIYKKQYGLTNGLYEPVRRD